MSLIELVGTLQDAPTLTAACDAVHAIQHELERNRANAIVSGAAHQYEVATHTLMVEHRRRERGVKWKARLAVQLAGCNGCRAVRGNGQPTLILVGRECNAAPLRLVFLVLVTVIERLCDERWKVDPEVSGERARYRLKNDAVDSIITALRTASLAARLAMPVSLSTELDAELVEVRRWIRKNVQLRTPS